MRTNVKITVRRGHEVVAERLGHNVWVDGGRSFLANLISFTSPISGTPLGSVDLVANFPALTNEFFYIRLGYNAGIVEYRVQLASPANAAQLLSQSNAQTPGIVATLGVGNALTFAPTAPTGIELVGGSAMQKLGLVPVRVSPAGMTTTPNTDDKVKYIGFGIGSKLQGNILADNPPLSTSYPAGSDPNATTGHEYDKSYPKAPLISSLERPVRISGGTTAYPGDPGDVWLVESPKFAGFIFAPGVLRFRAEVDATGGDIVYGPFTQVPISEVGLFLSNSDIHDPFNAGKLVAYHSFGTIVLEAGIRIELVWTVSF